MAIWISSLARAPELARKHKPARIVSLLSPYDDFPRFPGISADRHLCVAVHDIVADTGDWQAPGQSDAEQVVRFVEQWDMSAPLLIHCWAGISRSTATAFIAACIHNPDTDERDIAAAIREASPTASPNPRLVAHADDILGREGRMSAAVAAIGRGGYAMEATPFSLPGRFVSGASHT
ncbi:MAG: protein-tyrosine phosphatase family protein [Hyphomonadaceae bacterium]